MTKVPFARFFMIKKIHPLILPIGSLIIGIMGIFSSILTQYWSNQTLTTLKQYEVTFTIKQKLYGEFMSTLYDIYFSSTDETQISILRNHMLLEKKYYEMEPFLSVETREKIFVLLQAYVRACYEMDNKKGDSDVLISYRNQFRDILYPALFNK